MNLEKITKLYDLGFDMYKRKVVLVHTDEKNKEERWTLRSDFIGDSEKTETINGLTKENLLAIADIVKEADE